MFDILSGKRYRENRLAQITCGKPLERAHLNDVNVSMKARALALANGVELTVRKLVSDNDFPTYKSVAHKPGISVHRFAAFLAWDYKKLVHVDDGVEPATDIFDALVLLMYPWDEAVGNAIERRAQNATVGWITSGKAPQLNVDVEAPLRFRAVNLAIADDLLNVPQASSLQDVVARVLFHENCELAGRMMCKEFFQHLLKHPEQMK